MTTRVFLVDDHELVREGLRAVLEREPDMVVVGEAATASDGLAGVARTRPDIALLDLVLPDGDGIELCRSIKGDLPGVACVVLSSRCSDEIVLHAIRAEASGFLLKRTGAADLVRSLRVVAEGGSLIDPALTARLVERLRNGTLQPEPHGELDVLSPQERRLLDHLAEGLTNRQIAARMGLAEKTVKNYVSNLLRKLRMSSRTEAAVYLATLRAEHRGRNRVFDDALSA